MFCLLPYSPFFVMKKNSKKDLAIFKTKVLTPADAKRIKGGQTEIIIHDAIEV